MRKKFALLLTTTVLVLTSTTSAFAYEVTSLGEKQSGKSYETETITLIGGEEILVHYIPKDEKIVFENVETIPNTRVMAMDINHIVNEYEDYYTPGLEDTVLADYEEGKIYQTYPLIKQEWFRYSGNYYNENEKERIMSNTIWGMFVHSFNTDEDWDYDDKDIDAYFFKFADVPLLEPEVDEEPDKPVASDSNATNSNASRPSGGSSGGSSRKVVTDSRNTNGTWVQDSIGWWFKKLDGSYPKNEWVMIKDIWYHFNEQGYMQTGWLDLNGVKYYLNPNGAMVSNDWSLQGEKWYYFDVSGAMQANKWVLWKEKWYYLTDNGSMATNTSIDGYAVDQNGIWN